MSELLVAAGHTWESSLVARLGTLRSVRVTRRCPDLPDLLAAAAAGHGEVAVVSADLRGLDRDALARLAGHGVRVVGATPDGSEEAERVLRQLGIATLVHLGLPDEDLVTRLAETAAVDPLDRLVDAVPEDEGEGTPFVPVGGEEDQIPPVGEARGRVLAVWGPTGAPGRTTVAVNLAAEIAALGRSTLLVDLDTYGAAVGQSLSLLDEAPGVAAAARASELGRLDLPALARLAPEAAPGLRVLSGVTSASRWPELRTAAVEHVLDLSRGLAAHVVLDLGFCIEDDEELSYDTQAPRRNATTLVALEHADDLLVVGSADPVGLQRLVRAVQALASVPSPEPRPVVNRLRASAVGSDPARRVTEALARFAGLSGIRMIPDDPAALDAAMLRGATLAECAPQSPARLALRELAAEVVGVTPPPVGRSRRDRGRRRGAGRA